MERVTGCSRTFPVFVVLLTWVQMSFAQRDSADMFPLAIGKSWEYSYSSDNGSYGYRWYDVGSATCSVVGCVPSVDSTRWQLIRVRDFLETWPNDGNPQTIVHHDSAAFEIVEMNKVHLPDDIFYKHFTSFLSADDLSTLYCA